jgi:SAM-dependent methyltransferase
MTSSIIKKIVSENFRARLRKNLASIAGLSVTQGWENYARNFKPVTGAHLGDEWNEHELIGIDVPPDQIVATLDLEVLQPFLGTVDVLLEIGPGGGRWTQVLLPKANKLIAADPSPSMLSLLRKRFGNDPKLECVLIDGNGLKPIKDHSVDAGFSYDVFVHLEQWDIYNYLCELKRVLKPGGKALIHHGNTFSELGWKRFVSEVPTQVNIPKVWGTFSFMCPQVFQEFTERAGLNYLGCITNVVKRDGISLMQSPKE